MGKNLKTRIKNFWNRNKGVIIDILVVSGICAVGYAVIRNEMKDDDEPEEKEPKKISEAAPEEKKEQDPERQLSCGGWVLEDGITNMPNEFPEMIANDVPLDKMGEFGEELRTHCKDAGLDWYTNLDTAKASVWVTIEQLDDEENEKGE